ncbi:unnamed protein product [Ectocarpus sp. CCAP 1310/34]|nr:unnamed protein product [Ectocarpus sp. CCAP 1310/34]
MNHPQHNHNGADRRFPAGGGGGEGGSGAVKERSSWYRSQFKELENLGKGGFGTVVKVRNRVDRRLYAVKKVGLDPFDKETNRKIRREVTTISTLVHKNIVRYYQAWLEGGGGAFPAAVEEERSGDEDDDDDDEDDAAGAEGASALAKTTAAAVTAKGETTAAAVAATCHDVPGATDIGQSEEDQSEIEAELGFFLTTKSSSSANKNRNLEPKPTACAADSEHRLRDTGTMHTGLEGNEADGNHVHFDDGVGGRGCPARHSMALGEGDAGSTIAVRGEDSSAAPVTTAVLGKKAKRLLRKQARKKKRLLDVAAVTAAAVGSGDTGAAGEGLEETTGKGESEPLRIPRGRRKRAADAAAAAATAAATKKEAPWAQKRGVANHQGSFGSMASSSSSSGDSETVDTDNEAAADGCETIRTCDDDSNDDDDDDWSDQEESNDQGNTRSEEGSWGSGGGDYRPHGQGKLVSDAEFFQYFGSPERAR